MLPLWDYRYTHSHTDTHTPSSKSAGQALTAWFSVTGLAEKASVLRLSSAPSVLEADAAELQQSVAQREWPVLVGLQGGPSGGLHTS